MAAWVAFGALTLLLIGVLFLLSLVSAGVVGGTAAERPTSTDRDQRRGRTVRPPASTRVHGDARLPRFERPAERESTTASPERPPEMSTASLLANVALTQGLFGAAVLAAAIYFAIPFPALGFEVPLVSATAVGLGVVAGLGLWLGNEVVAALADAAGVGYDEAVRSMLTPQSAGGWFLLLGLILPTIAFVEELLFRGAAIGALSVGFPVPESVLVVGSSLAFGGAHGAQGRIGAAVATTMGLLLGAIFVVTGSLLVVVVAHYLVNALEFVVHEGLDVERPAFERSASE